MTLKLTGRRSVARIQRATLPPLRLNLLLCGGGSFSMLQFQERVVAEKSELDERLEKLDAFGRTELFENLPSEEQGRLNRQHSVMEEYSRILGERIAAFVAA
jgi:hypothetical protein